MTFQVKTRLITANEYQQMAVAGIFTHNDNIELIEGQILEMSPIGYQHASFVKRINALFNKLLADKATISVQDPIVIPPYSEPEPDIAILKPSSTFYSDRLPQSDDVLLLIEVADSSIEYDREVKLPIYAKAGIAEYWIVNIEEGNIEAYHSPIGKNYKIRELIRSGDQLHFRAFNLFIPADSVLG